jgi:menaquinone-specific isochorismate synthase
VSDPVSGPARGARVRTVEIPDPGPLPGLAGGDSPLFVEQGEGLVGFGAHVRIPVAGQERFTTAAKLLDELFASCDVDDEVELPGTGPVAFGAFTFDTEAAGSTIVVPRMVLGRRAGRAWQTVVSAPGEQPPEAVPMLRAVLAAGRRPAPASSDRVRYEGSSVSELAWLAAVDRAVRELRAGAARKVVLARDRRVWSRTPFDVRRLVEHLAERFPSCQTFAVDGLVGASPEILVRRTGPRVASLVLAGTAPRGTDDETDRAYAAALLASDKDLREHRFAVDSVADGLRPATRTLEVAAAPGILSLANVMHLATPVVGDLDTPMSALQLAGRLHPTAAVCGTPTERAAEMIRTLEGLDRARYSGPVGWVDARGDGQFAIALRCAEVRGSRARLFAGAGIVDGSLPEAELEETRLKLRAMQSAFDR